MQLPTKTRANDYVEDLHISVSEYRKELWPMDVYGSNDQILDLFLKPTSNHEIFWGGCLFIESIPWIYPPHPETMESEGL